ncbi:MAG: hypothetical protein Q7S42_02345 [Candidatus Omnitrophota bacterium]|nr:hypothetical protein [Candidatus Omnitrophota bacterium]
MFMVRFSHLLAIVPISILLTVSFFVLLALRKVDEKVIKTFGYVVVSFLWLSALVVFSGAIYNMAKGFVADKCMIQQKTESCCMSKMMQKDNVPAMVMPEKNPLPKDRKRPETPKCGGNKGFLL